MCFEGFRIGSQCVLPFLFLTPTPNAFASSIEDELFGTDAPPSEPAAVSATPSAPASEAPGRTFFDAMQKTSIGGRADWVLVSSFEGTEKPGKLPLQQTFYGLVYLDSRPSDLVRGYLKLNIAERSFRLLELWMKWQTENGIFWTIGKQPIKWGSATLWNPTDFLAAETRDPLAFFDDREGVQALRAHLPFESQNANLYFVVSLPPVQTQPGFPPRSREQVSPEQRNSPASYTVDALQLSARAEWAFESGEIAAAYAVRDGGPMRFGIDLSAGLGPIDIDSEASCTSRSRKKFYKRSNAATPADDAAAPQFVTIVEEERKQFCLPQAVVGSSWEHSYSDSDSFTLGVEYFWNGLGHDNPTLELVSYLEGSGTPLYLGQQYIGAWFFLPEPASWNNSSFQFNAIKNLSDFSELYRAAYIHEVSTYGRVSLGLNARRGLGEFRLKAADLDRALEAFVPQAADPNVTDSAQVSDSLPNSTPRWQADLTFSVTL